MGWWCAVVWWIGETPRNGIYVLSAVLLFDKIPTSTYRAFGRLETFEDWATFLVSSDD